MDSPPDPFLVRLLFAATHGDHDAALGLRRGAAAGVLRRVHRGVYVEEETWSRLDARGRHVIRVRAVTAGLSAECVVSHRSASVLHDMPRVRLEVPARVDVIAPRRTTTKTSAHLLRRPGRLDPSDQVVVQGMPVTTAARTVIDLARCAPFADAVLCLDAFLRRELLPEGHRDGAAVDEALADQKRALMAAAEARSTRGSLRAARAIDFASPWAENGGESLMRIALHELGAGPVELQRSFSSGGVFVGRCDSFLTDWDVAVELDGLVKYHDPVMLAGRTAAVVVRDQNRRDRRLLQLPEIAGVVHCDYGDVTAPQRLATLLQDAGVRLDPRRVRSATAAARLRFDAPPPHPVPFDEPRYEGVR